MSVKPTTIPLTEENSKFFAYQALIDAVSLLKNLDPDAIKAAAQALADGEALSADEIANRDYYIDLVNQNAATAKDLVAQKADILKSLTILKDGQKDADAKAAKLLADQESVTVKEAAIANLKNILDARDAALLQQEKNAQQVDISLANRESSLRANEAAVGVREANVAVREVNLANAAALVAK